MERVTGGAIFTEDQTFSGELKYKLKFGYRERYVNERFTDSLYNPYGAVDYGDDDYTYVDRSIELFK